MLDFQAFRRDERAIEGLPIRLVIALLVGVACLSVMLTIVQDLGSVGDEEIDTEVSTTYFTEPTSGSTQTITVTVTDSNDEPVPGAKVFLESGTARIKESDLPLKFLEGASYSSGAAFETNENGKATVEVPADPIDWRADQDRGTLTLDVIPPSEGNYKEDKSDTEIVVQQP